ncbi:MAG: hypothetical protein WD269_04255 [Acidimicrobiia bacterium]
MAVDNHGPVGGEDSGRFGGEVFQWDVDRTREVSLDVLRFGEHVDELSVLVFD